MVTEIIFQKSYNEMAIILEINHPKKFKIYLHPILIIYIFLSGKRSCHHII